MYTTLKLNTNIWPNAIARFMLCISNITLNHYNISKLWQNKILGVHQECGWSSSSSSSASSYDAEKKETLQAGAVSFTCPLHNVLRKNWRNDTEEIVHRVKYAHEL